jgi:hypothetical protein
MNPIIQTMGQEFLCRLSVFLLIFRFLSFSRKPLGQIEQNLNLIFTGRSSSKIVSNDIATTFKMATMASHWLKTWKSRKIFRVSGGKEIILLHVYIYWKGTCLGNLEEGQNLKKRGKYMHSNYTTSMTEVISCNKQCYHLRLSVLLLPIWNYSGWGIYLKSNSLRVVSQGEIFPCIRVQTNFMMKILAVNEISNSFRLSSLL